MDIPTPTKLVDDYKQVTVDEPGAGVDYDEWNRAHAWLNDLFEHSPSERVVAIAQLLDLLEINTDSQQSWRSRAIDTEARLHGVSVAHGADKAFLTELIAALNVHGHHGRPERILAHARNLAGLVKRQDESIVHQDHVLVALTKALTEATQVAERQVTYVEELRVVAVEAEKLAEGRRTVIHELRSAIEQRDARLEELEQLLKLAGWSTGGPGAPGDRGVTIAQAGYAATAPQFAEQVERDHAQLLDSTQCVERLQIGQLDSPSLEYLRCGLLNGHDGFHHWDTNSSSSVEPSTSGDTSTGVEWAHLAEDYRQALINIRDEAIHALNY